MKKTLLGHVMDRVSPEQRLPFAVPAWEWGRNKWHTSAEASRERRSRACAEDAKQHAATVRLRSKLAVLG